MEIKIIYFKTKNGELLHFHLISQIWNFLEAVAVGERAAAENCVGHIFIKEYFGPLPRYREWSLNAVFIDFLV